MLVHSSRCQNIKSSSLQIYCSKDDFINLIFFRQTISFQSVSISVICGELFHYQMRKLVLFVLLLLLVSAGEQAQGIIRSLERTVPGQGKVTIHQDPRIEALIGMERPATGEQKVIKTSGFRIQAYAGNNTRQAKNDADRVASRVKEYFPELSVYTSFISPRWLCRVGDFRSIEEADAMMRRLKATGMFKEVSIVRDQINIPI